MPYEYEWVPKGIHWKYHGKVTGTEVAEADVEFYRNSKSDLVTYQFFDLLEVEEFHWADSEMYRIVASDLGSSRSIENIRMGFAAAAPGVIAVTSRYIDIVESLGTTWKFRIFRTREEALNWCKRSGGFVKAG